MAVETVESSRRTLTDYNKGFQIGATLALAVFHEHAEAGTKTLTDLIMEYSDIINTANSIFICGYDAGLNTYLGV